jgi:heat shock protein HslJ
MRAAFLALTMLAACAAPEQPDSPTEPPSAGVHLSGTKWTQVGINAPERPTIEFEDDRAAGFAGCNRWFASVTQDGEELRFGEAGMTRMACVDPAASAAETNFIAAIEATRYGHYDRDALVLLDENQQVLARFERTQD